MSKRESTGGGNTLFNYFAKSPAAAKNSPSQKKSIPTTPVLPKKDATPKNSSKKINNGEIFFKMKKKKN